MASILDTSNRTAKLSCDTGPLSTMTTSARLEGHFRPAPGCPATRPDASSDPAFPLRPSSTAKMPPPPTLPPPATAKTVQLPVSAYATFFGLILGDGHQLVAACWRRSCGLRWDAKPPSASQRKCPRLGAIGRPSSQTLSIDKGWPRSRLARACPGTGLRRRPARPSLLVRLPLDGLKSLPSNAVVRSAEPASSALVSCS
jgi:hypothetical protein